jgi:hypothetical protein
MSNDLGNVIVPLVGLGIASQMLGGGRRRRTTTTTTRTRKGRVTRTTRTTRYRGGLFDEWRL